MLAVANDQPVTHDEPLYERLEQLKRKLEKYQRRTAFMVSQITNASPDFRAVNSALKDRMGRRERDVFTEADYRAALAVHAPTVRSEMLRGAAEGPRVRLSDG
jgi:hypothetical protein